jgi:hypothetical protein
MWIFGLKLEKVAEAGKFVASAHRDGTQGSRDAEWIDLVVRVMLQLGVTQRKELLVPQRLQS